MTESRTRPATGRLLASQCGGLPKSSVPKPSVDAWHELWARLVIPGYQYVTLESRSNRSKASIKLVCVGHFVSSQSPSVLEHVVNRMIFCGGEMYIGRSCC